MSRRDRLFAYLLFVLLGALALAVVRQAGERRLRALGAALAAALLLQLGLGIGTLLTHVAIPVAAAHQGGAIVLFTVMLSIAHALRRRARFPAPAAAAPPTPDRIGPVGAVPRFNRFSVSRR